MTEPGLAGTAMTATGVAETAVEAAAETEAGEAERKIATKVEMETATGTDCAERTAVIANGPSPGEEEFQTTSQKSICCLLTFRLRLGRRKSRLCRRRMQVPQPAATRQKLIVRRRLEFNLSSWPTRKVLARRPHCSRRSSMSRCKAGRRRMPCLQPMLRQMQMQM